MRGVAVKLQFLRPPHGACQALRVRTVVRTALARTTPRPPTARAPRDRRQEVYVYRISYLFF